MNIEPLTKHHLEFLCLRGGYTGSSESTLVKMPYCWKSRVAAHLCLKEDFFSEKKKTTNHKIFFSQDKSINSNVLMFWKAHQMKNNVTKIKCCGVHFHVFSGL